MVVGGEHLVRCDRYQSQSSMNLSGAMLQGESSERMIMMYPIGTSLNGFVRNDLKVLERDTGVLNLLDGGKCRKRRRCSEGPFDVRRKTNDREEKETSKARSKRKSDYVNSMVSAHLRLVDATTIFNPDQEKKNIVKDNIEENGRLLTEVVCIGSETFHQSRGENPQSLGFGRNQKGIKQWASTTSDNHNTYVNEFDDIDNRSATPDTQVYSSSVLSSCNDHYRSQYYYYNNTNQQEYYHSDWSTHTYQPWYGGITTTTSNFHHTCPSPMTYISPESYNHSTIQNGTVFIIFLYQLLLYIFYEYYFPLTI